MKTLRYLARLAFDALIAIPILFVVWQLLKVKESEEPEPVHDDAYRKRRAEANEGQ